MRRVATAEGVAGGGSGVAPRRKGLRNRVPRAEAHGYRRIVAPRLREKTAALCRDAAAGRLEALNAKGVAAISPALTRRRSGYAGKPRIAKPTLKELQHGRAAMMQPFQGWPASTRLPRVATSSQPWAGRWNVVGVPPSEVAAFRRSGGLAERCTSLPTLGRQERFLGGWFAGVILGNGSRAAGDRGVAVIPQALHQE